MACLEFLKTDVVVEIIVKIIMCRCGLCLAAFLGKTKQVVMLIFAVQLCDI